MLLWINRVGPNPMRVNKLVTGCPTASSVAKLYKNDSQEGQ
jgi:hypothetical protein